MAVDALELRPRNAVMLVDAAIRLCATSTGVWAITLPAGGAILAALFHLAEAVQRHRDLVGPAALFTAAWVFRAVSQGAACHYVDRQLLAKEDPSVRQSFLAALRRLPSLVSAAAFVAVLDAVLVLFTAGLGLLFAGAHQVAYAAAMRGQGHALGLYGTCSKLLGPARHSAPWVRLAGLAQLVLFANLHLATMEALSLGSSVMGLDVAFLARFTSLDNGVWFATVASVTFALFEPIRATTAALLLIDGRVRQEGLDLVAGVEQLPSRKRPRVPAIAVTALVLLVSGAAFAEPSAARERLQRVVEQCELEDRVPKRSLDDVDRLDAKEQSALSRFLIRVERDAFDAEDCESAEDDLKQGLEQIRAVVEGGEASAEQSRDDAASILKRPEFEAVPPAAEQEKPPDSPDGPSWWDRFMEWLATWLKNLFKDRQQREEPLEPGGFNGPMAGANAVVIGVLAVIVAVVLWLVLRGLARKKPDATQAESESLDSSPLTTDPMSALARPPEGWASLADELAAKGAFRDATRHLYLATLSRLHRDGAIDYDPTHSNWDYLVGFKGERDTKHRFKELTSRFDFAWYGHLEVTRSAYLDFRGLTEPLLVPAPPPGGDRA